MVDACTRKILPFLVSGLSPFPDVMTDYNVCFVIYPVIIDRLIELNIKYKILNINI